MEEALTPESKEEADEELDEDCSGSAEFRSICIAMLAELMGQEAGKAPVKRSATSSRTMTENRELENAGIRISAVPNSTEEDEKGCRVGFERRH